MAFRAASYWKSMGNGLRGSSNFTTSTSPKLKSYAAPTVSHHFRQSPQPIKSASRKGDFVPMCVALGMIGLSAGFGLYTIYHHMGRNPSISLKKSRRETIPEVVEPEHVAKEAEKFVKQSFFRKVAHIQDFDRQEVMSDPIRGDAFTRAVRVETLKDVGVDPKPN
ncbi:hypothetical protein BUALT_Bualt02G0098400 [Buddleja alternifolia]|uniref:Uncharacterized protein n=1 Tax=Buddleja alternifolia TaxID=168488 RepID=A0AAV6Y5Z5_9LAMI|nr:hypothetical protein BUALT_Bualt02G0098400 [Buddleja alternifolia]